MMVTSKKQKTSAFDIQTSVPCYIAKLPLELLAEILLCTKSPKDILALTRCSKFFCRTLLCEANQYIWRYARQNCLPEALPEPCPRFTESSFAAFVFDTGSCEICSKKVNFYKSFGLRVRLCANIECMKTFERNKLQSEYHAKGTYNIFETTLPAAENAECFGGLYYQGEWPNPTILYLYSDWSLGLQAYLEASRSPVALENFIDFCSAKSTQTKMYMQMCVALYSWKKKYLEAQTAMKNVNMKFSKDLAAKEGLDFWDMMNTSAYGALFKRKDASMEGIQQSDYNIRKDDIAAELVKVIERRTRRAHEAGYSIRRRAVERHYNGLRAFKQELPLPCLPSFRELPTIHQIQNSNSQFEKEIRKSLQSSPVQTLVRSELSKFHSEAKNALAGVLGFPDWKSPSNRKLHPADRLTARFRCRTCQRVEAKYKEFGSLDYAGAIMHLCSVTLDKPVPQMPFKASRFERDTKAITALSVLLEACDIEDDEEGSHESLSVIGPRVVCLSCDARILLEPLDVIGHSHRHETMQLAILSQSEADKILGDHPLSHGLAAKLTSKGKIALGMRNQKVYQCRHCIQPKPQTQTIPATQNMLASTDASANAKKAAPVLNATKAIAIRKEANVNRQPKSYIFDGLRCHLKKFHNIDSIRDEDFIRTLTTKIAGK